MDLALVTNLVSSQYKADQLFKRKKQHTFDLRQSLLPPAPRAKLPPKCVVQNPASMKRRNT